CLKGTSGPRTCDRHPAEGGFRTVSPTWNVINPPFTGSSGASLTLSDGSREITDGWAQTTDGSREMTDGWALPQARGSAAVTTQQMGVDDTDGLHQGKHGGRADERKTGTLQGA